MIVIIKDREYSLDLEKKELKQTIIRTYPIDDFILNLYDEVTGLTIRELIEKNKK